MSPFRLTPIVLILASTTSLAQSNKLSPRLLHRLETPTPIIAIYDHPKEGCVGRVCVLTAQPKNLASDPDLVAASMPTKFSPRNDRAGVLMGHYALRAHQSLTGAGTLIAVIDTGLDWTHDDFIDEAGNTRVAWLLDQTAPPAGRYPILEALGSGAVYSAADIQRALDGETGPIWESAEDVIGHGTHVAGSAAADDIIYSGAAPGARLVIVKAIDSDLSGFSEENVLMALAFVEEVARRERVPMVLNLSLGNQMGAHDGSTPIEVALDDLATTQNPRIAVVVAAGNERDRALHARAAACSVCLPTRFKVVVPSADQPTPERPARIVLDFWHSGSGAVDVHLVTPSGQETDPIGTRGPYGLDLTIDDGIVELVTSQEPHPVNGDHRTTVTLKGEAGQPLATGVWEVVFEGSAERIDGWVGEYDLAGPGEPHFATYVDPSNLVGPPATGLHTIAVGAYVSRDNWQDIEGKEHALPDGEGPLAFFSSPGPTRDNRMKPEVVAPGHAVVSSLSHYSDPRAPHSVFYYAGSLRQVVDEDHAVLSGTSTAAPFVSGLLALILESNPDLTSDQLKDALALTAKSDYHTGAALYDPHWGFGKPQAETLFEHLTGNNRGSLDPQKSLCGVTQPWLPPDGRASILAMALPKDRNGLPLGPNQQVTIEAPGAKFEGPVQDYMNGIYVRRLKADGLRGSEIKVTCKANGTRIHATPTVRLAASHQEMSGTGTVGGACNCGTGNSRFSLLFLMLIILSARKIRSC